jgi:hypothetical protein
MTESPPAAVGRGRHGFDPLSALGGAAVAGVPLSAVVLRLLGRTRQLAVQNAAGLRMQHNARTRLNLQLAKAGWHRELKPVGEAGFGAIAELPRVRHCLANLLSDHYQRLQPELVEQVLPPDYALRPF